MDLDELRERLRTAYDRSSDATHNLVIEFAQRLQELYPDHNRYRAYHLLVGSTATHVCDRDDFPEHEVEAFVRSLA